MVWNDEFVTEIFGSLNHISGEHSNECFKAMYEEETFFVKKVELRANETLNIARERIERTEQINNHFRNNGVKTVVAVPFDGEYTHISNGNLWVAYPWINALPANYIDVLFLEKIGIELAKMHIVSSPFHYINKSSTFCVPDFSWITEIENYSDKLFGFQIRISEIVRYAKLGYFCMHKLFKESELVLSHCDLHNNNILLDANSIVIIDWELSGSVNPYYDLFETALNMCGFCECKTNLQNFQSVISSYCSVSGRMRKNIRLEHIIDAMYLSIIGNLSYNIKNYIDTEQSIFGTLAFRHLKQFEELKKYRQEFQWIMEKNLM